MRNKFNPPYINIGPFSFALIIAIALLTFYLFAWLLYINSWLLFFITLSIVIALQTIVSKQEGI